MVGRNVNYQDALLNYLRKESDNVTIFLVNGFQLKGCIRAFDNYVIVLESAGQQHIIYKHAVSTIVPAQPIRLQEIRSLGAVDGEHKQ